MANNSCGHLSEYNITGKPKHTNNFLLALHSDVDQAKKSILSKKLIFNWQM